MPDNSPQDQAEQVDQVPAGRDDDGRFLPGHSGNPGERPRNPHTLATRLAEAILDTDAAALSRKAVELALAGDPVSLRFCLSRIIAPCRERGIDVELPPVHGAPDLAAAMTAVAEVAPLRSGDRAAAALADLGDTAELERADAEFNKAHPRPYAKSPAEALAARRVRALAAEYPQLDPPNFIWSSVGEWFAWACLQE